MTRAKNILFIMADQLRWDYLSCANPRLRLKTPAIDALAARGTRFTRAFANSPVCGSSRMCFYTGRYARSHGASWNGVPLKVGETTLGDHLQPLGMRAALVGKTHMRADAEGMARLGIEPQSPIGVHISQCGFEPFERDDGLHPTGPGGAYDPVSPYNAYLKSKGYGGDNPWDDFANAAEDENGEKLSGWLMKNAARPARVKEEDSETAYMTRRAMDFMREAGDAPWCLHLSYIKPHWPLIAPAPYHALFSAADVPPPLRRESEKQNPHPLFAAFMEMRVSRAFSRDEVRQTAIPAYMGLVKQLDDHIGALADFMEARGLLDNTLIVFTSDHGDYLGDHWLGEKDLFHECAVKIPLIIADPSPDAKRGAVCDLPVEAVDLAPTFLEFAGGGEKPHILEGRSLLPLLRGAAPVDWRAAVFSETDYSFLPPREKLGVAPMDSYLIMAATRRWKYIHCEGMPPMLFDLENDPDEFEDLGRSAAHKNARAEMRAVLYDWLKRRSQRTTLSDADIIKKFGQNARRGILPGLWDESDPLPK